MKTIIGLFKYALILSVLLMASFDVEFKYELLHFLTMTVLAMTCNVYIWAELEKFKHKPSFISDTIQAVNNPLVASIILFISFTHSWWFLLLFFAIYPVGQLFHFLLRGWVPWLYIFFLPYLLITSFIYSTNFFYLFLILLVPAYLFAYLYFKFFKKEF